uniref:Apoptosis inhibitor 5 n=1 Tax=Syphacia muris TaxID=451379 RepID=A0A0N5AYY2_9BILA
MAETPTVDDIYDSCNAVDNGELKDYSVFIAGTKSADVKVKKLSAQMIVRYWQKLDEQRKNAFSSLTSLLVDPDPETRKAVIREMSHLVKMGLLVEETANVLSELLQLTDRNDETTMVHDLLMRFLKSYPKEVLSAVFKNILASKEEPYRICLLKFVNAHINEISPSLFTNELKKMIEDQYREILRDVTAAEFDLIFDTMKSMECYKGVKGRLTLYNMVVEQIDTSQPLIVSDVQRCDQVLYFAEKTQALLSVCSLIFMKYLFMNEIKIVYKVNCHSTNLIKFLISSIRDFRKSFPGLRNRYLRTVADLMPFSEVLDESSIIQMFVEFMTLIPSMPSENGDINDSKGNGNEKDPEHELKLSELEALGIAVCTALKANGEVFQNIRTNNFQTDLEQGAVENWLKRMLYLARLLQQYIAGAKNDLKKVNEASSPDRDKNKQKSFENSLKKAENILKLAKDLVHTKPTFTPVQPSWKESTLKMAKKHKLNDNNNHSTLTHPEKKGRPVPDVYVPPSGKYSSTFAGKSVGRTNRSGNVRGRRGRY